MESRFYFILRGDHEHLARGELGGVLEAYSTLPELSCYTMLCIAEIPEEVASRAFRRCGFVKEYGSLRGVHDPYGFDPREIELGGLRTHVTVLKSGADEAIYNELVGFLEKERRGGGGKEMRLILTDGLLFVGVKMGEREHVPRAKKPFTRSIEITPDIARALINLARAREGEVLLDPFAGTGTILIEAWRMGIRGIGAELDPVIARGLGDNLGYFGANSIPIWGDSTELSYVNIGSVATDPPYGRGAATHGVDILSLYDRFLGRVSEFLPKGRYMSFMAPTQLEDKVEEMLYLHRYIISDKHYHYVHGGLTRVIFAVRIA